ncbi:hypothetical protein KUCAC02_022218, partial [Chaenocephalus aceratus]
VHAQTNGPGLNICSETGEEEAGTEERFIEYTTRIYKAAGGRSVRQSHLYAQDYIFSHFGFSVEEVVSSSLQAEAGSQADSYQLEVTENHGRG